MPRAQNRQSSRDVRKTQDRQAPAWEADVNVSADHWPGNAKPPKFLGWHCVLPDTASIILLSGGGDAIWAVT